MVLDQDREYISAEPPIIILSTKYHEPLGVINGIGKDTISINYNMNSADEISFDVYKRIDDVEEPLWEQIIDFKYIYVPAIQEYFSIEVSIDDNNDTVKHITGTSACEFELSNRYLYGFGVNDDTDWQAQKPQKDEDYIPTLFYRSDPEMKKYSLLDRVLADTNANLSDYSLSHVDASLANIQRKFVVDGQSVYQFLTGSVAKEVECLFVFDSVNRTIGAYDLAYVCENCGYRGKASAKCPKCENTNYIGGEHYSQYYGATIGLGANTSLYISAENYAEQITRNANVDNVFNCLRISGGDDIINTALRYVNPNGSRYLYRYNEDMLSDMPEELKLALQSYSDDYEEALEAYAVLSNDYYAAVDQKNFLEHTMMPKVTTPTTDAQTEANKLPTSFANFGNVCVTNIRTISNSSADLAVQGLAKVLADARYDVKASGTIGSVTEGKYRTWTGTIKVTNFGDSEDTATTVQFSVTLELADEDNPSAYPDYLYQRILKQIERDDNTFKDIFEITDINLFKQELTKYGLASLKSFYQTYDTILSILVESNAGDPDYDFHGLEPKLYVSMYTPYKTRQEAVEKEMKVREGQIYGLNGDKVGTAESPYQYADSTHTTESQQWIINQLTNQMQTEYWDEFNFRNYLETKYPGQGERLWRIYCHYRLESTYSNSNYISTGLENPQIIKNAQELFEVARREVVKASEPVYTLSTNLNDLLLDTEEYRNTSVKEARFSDVFRDKFKLGNWLAMQSDDEVFYLRLIALSIDYGSPENINVTFSEASKLSSIISDAQTVLDQAKNMAASYDSVAHQASQGEEAERSVTSWMQDGLSAALTKIKSNTNEEITYDKNGLHARSYDDIEEAYNDKQLRITHNVIAFTDDNWRTVKMAMGDALYAKYDEDLDRLTTNNPGYGVLSEYLNGTYITGSQICGGDLYSLNYSATNKTGSHIDLNTGYFSLAGGSIFYDGDRLSISIGGKNVGDAVDTVTIEYAKNTSPTVAPTSGWQPTQPARSEGEYLWQKTTITYLSDKAPEVTVVNITGIDGKDGEKGADGKGVKATTVSYAWWNSGTSAPPASSDRWRSTIVTNPDPTNYPYLWTKTIIVYTDNSNSTFYSVSKDGQDGKDGEAGKTGTGVSSVTTQYAIRYSASSSSGYYVSWSDSTPEYDENCYNGGYYYWTRTKTYYDNSSTPSYGDPVVNYGLTTANQIAYEDRQGINDLNNTTVLKVQNPSSGAIAAVKLSASASGASTFQIGATSIKLTADETIDFLSGGTINMESKTISITSSNFSVTSNGKITAKLGTIGNWNITDYSIYSGASSGGASSDITGYDYGGGSGQTTGFPWEYYTTISGNIIWRSTSNATGSTNKYTYSRCRINYSGYTKIVLQVLSCGESKSGGAYDYVIVGNEDAANILISDTSKIHTNFSTVASDEGTSPTSISSYHPIEITSDGGSHFIEVAYYKDSSNSSATDRAFVYVDESASTSSGGASDSSFILSTRDFDRLIGDTRRYNLRMAVGNNFALSSNGTLYANGGIFRGEITATSGKVGGWNIGTKSIYNGTNSMTSTSAGTYIGTDGIRQYNSSSQYLIIKDGAIESHYSDSSYIRISNGAIRLIGTDSASGSVGIKVASASTSSLYNTLIFVPDDSYSIGRIKVGGNGRFTLDSQYDLHLPNSFSGGCLLASSSQYNLGRHYIYETNITVDSLSNLGYTRYAERTSNKQVTSSVQSFCSRQLTAGNWIVFGYIQLVSTSTGNTSADVPDTKALQLGIATNSSSSDPSTTVMQTALSTKLSGPTDKGFVMSFVNLSSSTYVHLVAMQNSSTTTYAVGSNYKASNQRATGIWAMRISDYSAPVKA